MSIQGLFDKIGITKIVDDKTAAEIGDIVESSNYHGADIINEKRFVPSIDFSNPKNFAKYGSAEQYYEDSFTYVQSSYPYDGSLYEKLAWQNTGSYIDLYVFEKEYPRTTGYINFSYGGWGTSAAYVAGYGRPQTSDIEYISLKGGPGLGGGIQNQSANIWKPTNNRESNLEVDPTEGVTVEFWLKKSAFESTDTEKEVVLDIWNNELTSSNSYGRLRLELSGASGPTSGWLITLMSGTSGVQWESIGNTAIATILDGNWHHYAFSFLSASAGVTAKSYFDGTLQLEENLGSTGIDKIQGSIEAHVGSLITSPAGTPYHHLNMTGSGKLSASLDEFRYWKTQRSSQDIGRYWFTQVGGGTNTDLANTDLGVYYKFNEGITGDPTTDAVVLDYSGRVSNGSWTGYASGARNTGSAIVSSSAALSEFLDPIMYAAHPEVVSKLNILKLSGSAHDYENPSQMLSYFPSWMQERDAEEGNELKKLVQILSSYFDTLYLQIENFGSIHDAAYISSSYQLKPNTLPEHLLANKGLLVPELFVDADILEKLGDRSNERSFRDSLTNIKNNIYQNIYNNLINIYKTKGTRQSFRNLLRCFGVDEKIYKLNVYGNNSTYTVRNNRELYSTNKKYADFSQNTRFDSTVFLTSSADSNTVSYLSGFTELTGGYANTLEAYIFFPHKPEVFEKAHENYRFDYLTSSLFGQHTVYGHRPQEHVWNNLDTTNFQVYAVRDQLHSKDVKFVLSSSAGGVISALTSSYYDDVYTNTNWVFAVTVKPTQYPLVNYITGTLESSYTVEFKGAQVDAGEILNSFIVTSSVDAAQSGYGFVTGSKRVYVGAHRQDFTGSVLNQSDVRVGFCRYWLDDVTPSLLEAHGMDIQDYGPLNPARNPYLFQGNQSLNLEFIESDTLALNWDFETVSSSDASGEFVVADFSSGSTQIQSSRYGFLGNLLGAQHTGYGYGFPASSAGVINTDYVLTAEVQDFEILNSKDMISVLNVQDDIEFTRESRPINYFFAIEKSMYRTISEDMIHMFAVINDFNNIVGSPVNKYRNEYRDLRILREKFFERVGNTPDLDKYVEFYKWFDSSLGKIINQLIPAGAAFSENIRNMVESHVLERSKYKHRMPTIELFSADTEGTIRSPLPLSPGWQYTHHPINDLENTNANWWKNMAQRNSGSLASAHVGVNNDKQLYFNHSTKEGRDRKERNIYRFDWVQQKDIRAGITAHKNKKNNFVFNATAPYGPVVPSTNIPTNIMLSFNTDVQELQDIADDLTPGKKKRLGFGIDPQINVDLHGGSKQDGNLLAPFSLYSSSVSEGYNSSVVAFYTSSVLLTNLHEDIVFGNDTRPLQGPFTEGFVGGRQYRHTKLNDGNDNRETRAEGFRIELGLTVTSSYSGALGVVPPNYPFADSPFGAAPAGFLPNIPVAHRLRDEGVKRPVNIKNILMTTASAGVRLSGTIAHGKIGNYQRNYQIVQTFGRTINDLYFRKQSFSFALNPETTATRGRFPLTEASTANVSGNLNFELPNRAGPNANQTVVVNRFNAPGSYEASSKGYLDPAHEEKSVYNVLPYRNLGVLSCGLSGSASVDPSTTGSIVVRDQIDKARGLRQRLSLHCGPFGSDAAYGSVPANTYVTIPSYYKSNRNRKRRIEKNPAYVTASVYDNWYIHHLIPRSEQQYQWITSSIAPGEIIYGYSKLSGGYFLPALPLLSMSYAETVTADDVVAAVNFDNLNIYLYDPLTASVNTLGYPLSQGPLAYRNTAVGQMSKADIFNSLMLQRNGPYQAPSWKQIRYADHPISRNHRKNNILSVRVKTRRDIDLGARKGNSISQFIEPQVYASEIPMVHRFNIEDLSVALTNTFGNKLVQFANYEINNILGIGKQRDYNSANLYFNRINSMILSASNKDQHIRDSISNISAVYRQTVYPAAYNAFLNRTRSRINFSITDVWDDYRANRASTFPNSQNITLDASIWHLDAHDNYTTTSSVHFTDGAGELQNNYSRYFQLDPGKGAVSQPAASYAARVPLGYTGSAVVVAGDKAIGSITITDVPDIDKGVSVTGSSGIIWRFVFSSSYDGSGDPNIYVERGTGSGDSARNLYNAITGSNFAVLSGGVANYTAGHATVRLTQSATGTAGNTTFYTTPGAQITTIGFGSGTDATTALGNLYPVFGGDQPWDAVSRSVCKTPYQTYEEYSKNLRLAGKDYSLVPEFRISNHLAEYLQVEEFTTLTNIDDLLELTGTAYQNSSETGFYREYSNSDFLKMFEVVDNVYEGAALADGSKMSKDKLALRCSALLKFLPYKGFYPAERTIELASLFYDSYYDFIETASSSVDYRAFLEPFYSQGIMYNTIKSGMAVGHFVLSNTASQATQQNSVNDVFSGYTASVTDLPEGALNFEGILHFSSSDMNGSASADKGYFPQKIPFEALYNPPGYGTKHFLSGADGTIYDNGLGSASIEMMSAGDGKDHYINWSGEGKVLYGLAIDNFLCETANFFNDRVTTISSETEDGFGTAQEGALYKMTLKVYRPYNRVNEKPDYDKFNMYTRMSAFGPPLASCVTSSTYSASYSHLTPAYYDGSGSVTYTFIPEFTGRPTLDEIFANTTLEYGRDEWVPLRYAESGAPSPYSSSIRMEVNDSFNLTESVTNIMEGTEFTTKQWIVQPKFETPILNFAGTTASATPPTTVVASSALTSADLLSGSGLWHTYGRIPTGSDEGVFAIIEEPNPRSYGSLASLVGMPAGQPFRIGRVKRANRLEEAVVAVPFFVGKDGRRKFYKLDLKSKNSIKSIQSYLKKYIFPPRLDFVINPQMDKIAMYVFEFGVNINQQDIADMWQNLPPSICQAFEEQISTVEHKLLRDQMINTTNRKLRSDLRWMVFKVKKRAEKGYTRLAKKGWQDNLELIPSNIGDAKYTYNWPYDYFSLVELIKIDEGIEYSSELPPDSRVEIVGDVNINTPNGITLNTEDE